MIVYNLIQIVYQINIIKIHRFRLTKIFKMNAVNYDPNILELNFIIIMA